MNHNEKPAILTIISCGFIAAAAFIHIVNWDKYSLEIIPLKISQFFGLTNSEKNMRIADICHDRHNYDCEKTALNSVVAANHDLNAQLRVADLYRKTQDYKIAVVNYEAAIAASTKGTNVPELNSNLYFGLARSYEGLNNLKKATENYQLALKTKPQVIQITVVEAYAKLLLANGMRNEALKLARHVEQLGGSLSIREPASSASN